MIKKPVASLCFLAFLTLGACSEIPPQAYYNRGDPENLIDMSSEVVTVGMSAQASLSQLSSVIEQDPPSRATLNCAQDSRLCDQARDMLQRRGVNVQAGNGTASGNITLMYERVTAHDCENRYIDNSVNPYNLPMPTSGCSVTGNMVQMVSDKRQFTNPALLDFQDGDKAAQTYENYRVPPAPPARSSGYVLQVGGGS